MVVDIQFDCFNEESFVKVIENKMANSYYSAELLFSYINANIDIKIDGVKLVYIDNINLKIN